MRFAELESEQLRRIFRDFLKGVPKERTMKKYGLTNEDFWKVIGLYHKPGRHAHAKKVAEAEAAKALEAKSKAAEAPKAKAPAAPVLTKETKNESPK